MIKNSHPKTNCCFRWINFTNGYTKWTGQQQAKSWLCAFNVRQMCERKSTRLWSLNSELIKDITFNELNKVITLFPKSKTPRDDGNWVIIGNCSFNYIKPIKDVRNFLPQGSMSIPFCEGFIILIPKSDN